MCAKICSIVVFGRRELALQRIRAKFFANDFEAMRIVRWHGLFQFCLAEYSRGNQSQVKSEYGAACREFDDQSAKSDGISENRTASFGMPE